MIRTLAALLAAAALAGCLREDEISALAVHPDGSRAAVVSARRGLAVVDLAEADLSVLVREGVTPGRIAWTHDGSAVAFGMGGPPLRVALARTDGGVTTFPRTLAKVWHPLPMPDGRLLARTTGPGYPALCELTTASLAPSDAASSGSAVYGPVADGRGRLAWVEFHDLRPVLVFRDSGGGGARVLARGEHPLDMEPDSLAFSHDGTAVLYLSSRAAGVPALHKAAVDPGAAPSVQRLLTLPQGTNRIVALADGRHLVAWGGETAVLVNPARKSVVHMRAESLPVTLADACGDGMVAVAAGQLPARYASPGDAPRWVLPAFDNWLVLAEELFRGGRREASARIYDELRASVRGSEDPRLLELLHVANVARLGRPTEAAAMLQRMVEEHRIPVNVPEADVWKLLGMTRLLAGAPRTATLAALGRYEALATAAYAVDGERPPRDDIALNALAILRSGDTALADLHVRALGARLGGNLRRTIDAYTMLLRRNPEMFAVQAEYLRALRNVEREIFRLGPSQILFDVPPATRIAYLELFHRLCPDSVFDGPVTDELLQLHVENGGHAQARALIRRELDGPRAADVMDRLTGYVTAYLEMPENTPWLEPAVGSVVLEATVFDAVTGRVGDDRTLVLWHIAAAKHALVGGRTAGALGELAAAARLDGGPVGSAEVAYWRSRRLALEARGEEMRGDHARAAELLRAAASLVSEHRVDEFEMYAELVFRAGLLESQPGAGEGVAALLAAERAAGDDLVAPTWDRTRLRRGLDALLAPARAAGDDASSGTARAAVLLAGVALAKLEAHDAARGALMLAADADSPPPVRMKALVELAALDEYEDDPWGAARRHDVLCGAGLADRYLRDWSEFERARLHLELHHETDAAAATLARLAGHAAGAPLAVRAQELLDAARHASEQ